MSRKLRQSDLVNSFVMHAALRVMESTSSTMKWPDSVAAQKIEELDFRPTFDELRERLVAQSVHDADVELRDALEGSSLTANASPNTPEMSTVSQLASEPTCVHDHLASLATRTLCFQFRQGVNQKSKPKQNQRVQSAADRMAKVVIATLSVSEEHRRRWCSRRMISIPIVETDRKRWR